MVTLRSYPPLVQESECLAGCSCGKKHPSPSVSLYFEEDADIVMSEDVAAKFRGGEVLLISDPRTDEAAGQRLRSGLRTNGVKVHHALLHDTPHATDVLADELEKSCLGKKLIISVGSGTVNDLGKFCAGNLGLPFWTMPTAPSMNGYTSGIAAIQVKGVKRTLPAPPPRRIYAIPSVVRSAPSKLLQAGFCDVMAKVVSDIDWQCESMLVSNSYCSLPSVLMADVEARYKDCPDAIGMRDEEAVNGLFQGLLISGVAMSLAGSSAPASGGEHLLSHFLDMREPITGRVPELHGLQVGMGILLSTACYQRLAGISKAALPTSAIHCYEETENRIPDIWHHMAQEVKAQFQGKRDILLSFTELFPANFDKLLALFGKVKSPDYFLDLFSRIGTPFTLKKFNLDEAEFRLAARNCRAIRNRITVLDFAAHAGVLDDAVEDVLSLI